MASSVPKPQDKNASTAHEVQQKEAVNRELPGTEYETHNSDGTTSKLSPKPQESSQAAHRSEATSQAHSVSGEKSALASTLSETPVPADQPVSKSALASTLSGTPVPADQPVTSQAYTVRDTPTEIDWSQPGPSSRLGTSKPASPKAQPATKPNASPGPQKPSGESFPPATTVLPDITPSELPGKPHAQTEEQPALPATGKPPQRIPMWKRRLLLGDAYENKAAPVVPPEELPLPPPLSGRNSASFAYVTVRDRLPVILTRVIDAVFRDRMTIGEQLGPEAREETKAVAGRLAKLRNEMVTNKPLVPIEDDFEDAAVWNAVLAKYTKDPRSPPRWYEAPWLYIETYFYRRIYEAFQLTTKLRDYDPFRRPKQESLRQYFKAVCELCDFVRQNTYPDAALETLKQSTYRLIEVSLWGNRCDLSLSCGASLSNQSTGAQETDRLRPFILSNHGDRLWQHLCRLRERNLAGEPQLLHCVMDNSGYELVTDLALFDFLYETGYVDGVTIHIKAIPWYVSDVTRRDLFWTLREMQDCDHESTQELSKRCQRRINDGSWSIMDDVFWTQPFDYAEMARRRPDLYAVLQSADLLLFKGDLNYRKLVGDLDWDPTVSFEHALRGFEPTFLCTLRTIKADTVAGLDRVVVDRVKQQSPDWMITGQYAVMQCAGTPVERERTVTATPPRRAAQRKLIHAKDPLLARDVTGTGTGSPSSEQTSRKSSAVSSFTEQQTGATGSDHDSR